jgi:hypothetical protein
MEVVYDEVFFEDTFTIDTIFKKKESKKVKTVVVKKTDTNEYSLKVDINTDIYPLKKGDCLSFQLTNMINNKTGFEKEQYSDFEENEIIKKYEYVTQGKIYDYKSKINYVSFGGLLMQIQCGEKLEVGKNMYLLIKKKY